MAVEELEHRHYEIPRDRDVVLFCACPNEVTSARMALLLKKNGISRVRPLVGGVAGLARAELSIGRSGNEGRMSPLEQSRSIRHT